MIETGRFYLAVYFQGEFNFRSRLTSSIITLFLNECIVLPEGENHVAYKPIKDMVINSLEQYTPEESIRRIGRPHLLIAATIFKAYLADHPCKCVNIAKRWNLVHIPKFYTFCIFLL